VYDYVHYGLAELECSVQTAIAAGIIRIAGSEGRRGRIKGVRERRSTKGEESSGRRREIQIG